MNNKQFHCVMEFMDHLKNNHVHKYTPHKELEKTYNRVMENQKQLEKTKEIDFYTPL